MSAVIQVHPHESVARLQYGKKHRHIRLCPGMRLYIDILAAKQLPGPVFGQLFHDIHTLAAAVISFSRISFRVFVRQRTSHSRHHGPAHPVL